MARKLFIYMSIFGPPKVLLSDQGKEFLNQIVNNLATVCGAERRVTSPYKPSTNGLTERFNETLVISLKKHCEDDPKSWDKWIPYVLMAYRTRVHSVTNCTPFQLMFGRPMNKFEDFVSEKQEKSLEQRAEEIRYQVEEMQPKAINAIKTNQVKQKKTQDKRHQIQEHVPVGTKVTIRSCKMEGILPNKYNGIFTISGITKRGNY